MSETNNEAQEPEMDMSPEQYHKLRLEAQKELREEIKFLKTENDYQELLANIEENKARRLKAIAIQYQLQNPQAAAQRSQAVQGKPPANEVYDHPQAASQPFKPKKDVSTKEDPKVRKLKTD